MHRRGVVALVIGGFGLAVLAIVVSSLREAAAMKRWPVAEGLVLSAKVEKYRQSVSRGTGGPRDRMTLYRPVLVYEYEVAGKRFRGSRIAQSPGLDRGVPEFAEKVVERYPAGRYWNRGCLAAGSSERRSVSRCWCWRPTLITEVGKARSFASSDAA